MLRRPMISALSSLEAGLNGAVAPAESPSCSASTRSAALLRSDVRRPKTALPST